MNDLYLQDILSTRELASLIWTVILLIILLFRKDLRIQLKKLFTAALDINLWMLYLSFIIYAVFIIIALWLVKFWNILLLNDSLIWLIFSGLGILFHLHNTKDSYYFVKIVKNNITIAAIVEFITNMSSFSFLTEMICVPITLFLTILNIYSDVLSKYQQNYKTAASCLNTLLWSICLIYFSYSIYRTVADFQTINWQVMLKQFLLPAVLTAAFVPYFWIITIYLKYERLFASCNVFFRNKNAEEQFKIKCYILYSCRLSFKRIRRICNKISSLAKSDGIDYKTLIKNMVKEPEYKKSRPGNKMRLKLFNDIDKCCKLLSTLQIGELCEWRRIEEEPDVFFSTTSCHSIYTFGLSTLLLSLQGEKTCIHQLNLSMTFHSAENREYAVSIYQECISKILGFLSLTLPRNIDNFIVENSDCQFSDDCCSVHFENFTSDNFEFFKFEIVSK